MTDLWVSVSAGSTNGRGRQFVFDLLGYADGEKVIVETDRKRIDVMQYDSEQFSETGGWGYDTFVGDGASLCQIGGIKKKRRKTVRRIQLRWPQASVAGPTRGCRHN
jgi:hypothetical protein